MVNHMVEGLGKIVRCYDPYAQAAFGFSEAWLGRSMGKDEFLRETFGAAGADVESTLLWNYCA